VSPNGFEAIHAHILRFFPELVEELGGHPDLLLKQAGIEHANAGDPPHANYRQFVGLLERAAADLVCPDFGMQLAALQAEVSAAGPFVDAMRNATTFGNALQFVCSHSYAHSLAAGIWMKRSLSGNHTVLGHDILLDRLPQKAQAMEHILLSGHLLTHHLTEGRVRPRRVLFRHQPLSPLKTYRQYFGCEVRFGRSADAIAYNDADLACALSPPDPQAYESATTLIESRFPQRKPPLQARARGVITHFLGTDLCTKERVAAELGMHSRTMHRHLVAAGTSFQQIKDEVRRDRIMYYLGETGLEFGLISEKLGFSEQAVLTRCCRKWFAMSPTRLRSELQSKSPSS
jgi:AraC-like DNA-binding protein